MSSFISKREARNGGKTRLTDKQPENRSSSFVQRRESNTGSGNAVNRDADRLSFVGSVKSDMSTSVLEKHLRDARERISKLEAVTQQQADIIAQLQNMIKKKNQYSSQNKKENTL
jgi:uncharacterized spore protein YtfJ